MKNPRMHGIAGVCVGALVLRRGLEPPRQEAKSPRVFESFYTLEKTLVAPNEQQVPSNAFGVVIAAT